MWAEWATAALDGLARFGPACGTPGGVATPGLMSVLAGIGHGLLRLAAPERSRRCCCCRSGKVVAVSTRRRPRRRTVPLRHQLTVTECGAACLAMVASYYGRTTAVSECREILGVGRDGVSARQIAQAASALGMVAEAVHCPDPYAQPLAGPVIAFVAGGHFVVVERIGRQLVRIVKPGAGGTVTGRSSASGIAASWSD